MMAAAPEGAIAAFQERSNALWSGATSTRRSRTPRKRPGRSHARGRPVGSMSDTSECHARCGPRRVQSRPWIRQTFHAVETRIKATKMHATKVLARGIHSLWARVCGPITPLDFSPFGVHLSRQVTNVKLRFSWASPRVMVLSTNPQPRSGSLVNLN